ncbi:hypothetical protein [Streptomyces koelreuteriae]|uniref:hypothetical protein n=1 Tax=Streptomyces koelreuteriae TaxID=2838015 RepID=UPI003EB96C61
MERPRSARLARGALLWAALVLPALTADRIGLNEPRTLWQQAVGAAVLAAAAALSRRLPLAAFGLTATLSLTYAPSLFTASYGPALGTSALLLGLRAGRARSAPRMVVVTPVAPAEPGEDPIEERRAPARLEDEQLIACAAESGLQVRREQPADQRDTAPIGHPRGRDGDRAGRRRSCVTADLSTSPHTAPVARGASAAIANA